MTVITSDKERLQQTVGRSMARTSATELLRGKGAICVCAREHPEGWNGRETMVSEERRLC